MVVRARRPAGSPNRSRDPDERAMTMTSAHQPAERAGQGRATRTKGLRGRRARSQRTRRKQMRKPLAVTLVLVAGVLALAAALTRGPGPQSAAAASHREAPLIALDPAADISDFFMFRSYEPGHENNVVLIMDVIRGAVDQLGLPLSYVAVPPITKLDGDGSQGLGLRQKYSVTMTRRNGPGPMITTQLGDDFIAVPSNVGPRTTPNYADLAAQGIYDVGGGIRLFAGQRQDPFYIDLGGTFDTLTLRRTPPLLSAGEDADETVNPFGVDMLAGFNVHEIAIEVPSATIANGSSVLGGYASTNRARTTVRGAGKSTGSSGMVQVQRLANPLINEVVIGTEDKDYWNSVDPARESEFLDYYLNPRLATALELVYGVPTGCTPFGTSACSTSNRDDLVNVLLKYDASDTKLSELLRLNLGVAPTPLASQKRLTILAGDNAGWPNGRRPRDDVTDVAIRVVGGPNYLNGHAGDGVNVDDAALIGAFPFLAPPADGRNYNSGATQTPHKVPPTS